MVPKDPLANARCSLGFCSAEELAAQQSICHRLDMCHENNSFSANECVDCPFYNNIKDIKTFITVVDQEPQRLLRLYYIANNPLLKQIETNQQHFTDVDNAIRCVVNNFKPAAECDVMEPAIKFFRVLISKLRWHLLTLKVITGCEINITHLEKFVEMIKDFIEMNKSNFINKYDNLDFLYKGYTLFQKQETDFQNIIEAKDDTDIRSEVIASKVKACDNFFNFLSNLRTALGNSSVPINNTCLRGNVDERIEYGDFATNLHDSGPKSSKYYSRLSTQQQ